MSGEWWSVVERSLILPPFPVPLRSTSKNKIEKFINNEV